MTLPSTLTPLCRGQPGPVLAVRGSREGKNPALSLLFILGVVSIGFIPWRDPNLKISTILTLARIDSDISLTGSL
jgi:hypothetical protein